MRAQGRPGQTLAVAPQGQVGTLPLYRSEPGQFELSLPEEARPSVFEDSPAFLAVTVEGPARGADAPPGLEWRILVQRFRSGPGPVQSASAFEAALAGVLLGLEDALRPVVVLERTVEPAPDGLSIRADLVLRGRQAGHDVLQRRRLIAPGLIPPAALFLLTASCAAERFLVHRRLFEEVFQSFRWTGPSSP